MLKKIVPKFKSGTPCVYSLYGHHDDINSTADEIKSILLEDGFNPIVIKNSNNLPELMTHHNFDTIINTLDKSYIDPDQIIHLSRFVRATQIWHPWVFKVDRDAETRFVGDLKNFDDRFCQVYPMKASLDTKKEELEKYY